jgi:hypothetical protein
MSTKCTVQWLLLLASSAALPETLPERIEPAGITHWDTGFQLHVKGRLVFSSPGSEVTIVLKPCYCTYQDFSEASSVSGSVVPVGVDFEYVFDTFWGGTHIEGNPPPHLPVFHLMLKDKPGNCVGFTFQLEKRHLQEQVVLDLGRLVLLPNCPPQELSFPQRPN